MTNLGKNRGKVFWLLLLTIFFLGSFLISFSMPDSWNDDSLRRHQTKSTIRIGYAIEAPFSYLDEEAHVTGEAPEIARIICKNLGIKKIFWKLTDFKDLLDDLEAERFDVIAAGMFKTPEREENFLFSHPTYLSHQGFLVPAENQLELTSYHQACQNPDLKIAVLSGSVEEKWFLKSFPDPKKLVRVPDVLTGKISVENGLADCLALTTLSLNSLARQNNLGRTKVVKCTDFHSSEGAFVFRKSDRALKEAWNKELENFIGTPPHLALASGFGFSREDLPRPSKILNEK